MVCSRRGVLARAYKVTLQEGVACRSQVLGHKGGMVPPLRTMQWTPSRQSRAQRDGRAVDWTSGREEFTGPRGRDRKSRGTALWHISTRQTAQVGPLH